MEKETATHSRILAWENPMERQAWQATVHKVAESQTTERLNHSHHPVMWVSSKTLAPLQLSGQLDTRSASSKITIFLRTQCSPNCIFPPQSLQVTATQPSALYLQNFPIYCDFSGTIKNLSEKCW